MVKETEWRLGSNVIQLPLTYERVLLAISLDLNNEKDSDGITKIRVLTKGEIEWILFLCKKSRDEFVKYEVKRNKLLNSAYAKTRIDMLMFYEIQIACSLLISYYCCFLLERDLNIRFSENKEDVNAALQQIEELKQALADTRAELAKAQAAAPQEVGNPKLSSAQKAAQARSEKSLEKWKKVFPAMLKVYARCMEEGEKPRQGPDFNVMFNELDAELTDSQMTFFRSCLPEGYADKEGGKPGKV